MNYVALQKVTTPDLYIREDLYKIIEGIVLAFNLHYTTEMVEPKEIDKYADQLKELFKTYKDAK